MIPMDADSFCPGSQKLHILQASHGRFIILLYCGSQNQASSPGDVGSWLVWEDVQGSREREEIALGLAAKQNIRVIARTLGPGSRTWS
jgi:hypothetical protein